MPILTLFMCSVFSKSAAQDTCGFELDYSAVGGSNAFSVNVSSLPMGNYALTLQSAQKLYQGHFIKL